MRFDFSGVELAVLGGDGRELILAEHLAGLNARVKVFGLPVEGENIVRCDTPHEAIDAVKAVILPVPGVNARSELYSAYLEKPLLLNAELMAKLPPATPVFVGIARTPLKKMVDKLGLRLIEVMDIDEIAILNSIPSAEGAVQLAMEKMPITIHGSKAWVLGFGRTGVTLARLLKAMGAKTTVIARNNAQLARAVEMGMQTAVFSEMENIPKEVDVIFNTVPAPVLSKTVLENLPNSLLIIDIASSPGGTDFEAAKSLGIEAIPAPGLPGKVAPKTAGQILARVIPRLLAEELTLR